MDEHDKAWLAVGATLAVLALISGILALFS